MRIQGSGTTEESVRWWKMSVLSATITRGHSEADTVPSHLALPLRVWQKPLHSWHAPVDAFSWVFGIPFPGRGVNCGTCRIPDLLVT